MEVSAPVHAPAGVILIGHSYIRSLRDFMNQHPDHLNLGFPRKDAIVQSFARGGATLRLQPDDHWINCQLQPALTSRPAPAIIVLHVGENDLSHLTDLEIADHLWSLVQYITSVCHPHVIIISQLLWFPAHEDRHAQITSVNCKLQEYVQNYCPVELPGHPTTKVELLKHKFGIWTPSRSRYFSADQVHLNEEGLRKYCLSIYSAVGHHLKQLLQA